MVEVEEGALRALEEHLLAVAQRAVDEQRGVGDVRAQAVRLLRRRQHRLGVERLEAVHPLEPDVLLGYRELDLLAQDLRIEQVHTRMPIRVALSAYAGPMPRLVVPIWSVPRRSRAPSSAVPRHDQMRVAGDEDESRSAMTSRLELVQLSDHDVWIDDATGSDRAHLALDDS